MELEDYRQSIDEIDDRIAELLEQRYKLVSEIARYKAQTGKGIHDGGREEQILNRINEHIENREYAEYILDTFCAVMDYSRQYQGSFLGNIVLIGMPGCGKSTVGKNFAESEGYAFTDADEEFTRVYGSSPCEYISKYGEAEFRERESRILEGFTPNCRTVYALGGGVVTVPENFEIVKPLGTVIYLRRDIDKPDTSLRPISIQKGAAGLSEERSTIYELWADIAIDNNDSVEAAVKKIKDILQTN